MADTGTGIQDEIEKLRAIVTDTNDPRLSAILLAVTDERVQAVLADRIAEGHTYVGAITSFAPGKVDVVFSFARARGRFGLVPVSVMATVAPAEQRVLQLVEHYLPTDASGLGARQPSIDLNMFMIDRTRLPEEVVGYLNGPTSYWV
jgi:hypothetical protein